MLQHCCPCIITRLGPPILLVTGIPYVRGPLTQLCLQFWLLGEPSSLGPVPMAQEWQSPWGSSPCPALSLPYPSLPVPQSRNCTRCSAPLDQWPLKLLLPSSFSIPSQGWRYQGKNTSSAAGAGLFFQTSGHGP